MKSLKNKFLVPLFSVKLSENSGELKAPEFNAKWTVSRVRYRYISNQPYKPIAHVHLQYKKPSEICGTFSYFEYDMSNKISIVEYLKQLYYDINK